jgi:two-component system OmpR family response regulator
LRILLVDDDREICDHIVYALRRAGHETVVCHDGSEGLKLAQNGGFDALILDRMLPGLDGVVLIRCLRADGNKVPAIFVTALNGLNDRVEGLRAGANDYLAKPFSFPELLARLEAMARRNQLDMPGEPTRLTAGDVEVDLIRRTVNRAGIAISLTPQEFLLLEFLMRNAGRLCTRQMLLENVWDIHFDPGTNIVHVHMSRLRSKLGATGFRTVPGMGYIFSPD